MPLYSVNNGNAVLWDGSSINGVRYPMGLEARMSATELAKLGLYKVQKADPIPAGFRSSKVVVGVALGKPKYEHVLDPIVVPTFDVKAEAQRRIEAIAPGWRQNNMNRRSFELARKGTSGVILTPTEVHELTVIDAVWAAVDAVRAASNALELMAPIPLDYAADSYWVQVPV